MATQQLADIEQKVKQVQEHYADAPQIAKTSLENVIRNLKSGAPVSQPKKLRWKAPAGSVPVRVPSRS